MSDANEQLRRFHAWVKGAGDGQYQPALARDVLQVASVTTDSNGAIISVEGGLMQGDGSFSEASFTVPMGGRAAAVGDFLLVGHDKSRAVGAELTYLGHTQTLYPGSGLVIIDANLPAPTGLAIASAISKQPGSILANATITFVGVEARYQPSGYIISYRVNGGAWADQVVPIASGTPTALIAGLPPGGTLDVHVRARYQYAGSDSPPTADVTATLAADSASPGTATAITADVTAPNTLRITVTATIDTALLRGYRYEVHTAPTGTAAIISDQPGPQWDAVVPAGTYYVAARPISKSGVLGTRFPSTGFQGPYVVADQSANLDTTAPGAIGAPTLAGSVVQFADNTWHGFLAVTRPAYTPPADLAEYEISITVSDGRNWITKEPVQTGVTSWKYEVGFGTFTVAMRGRDQAGNRPAFGSTATATNTAPALSNSAPTVTTATVGAGIKVGWTPIAGALGYEVQRATSAIGAGATTVATVDSLWYFDPLVSDTIILPTYWYRVRPVSVSNGAAIQGTYSSWVTGTAGAVDAQNLRLLSITSGLIAADAITANKILAGAVTAAKLEADLILASMIRTATSGTRWETEGHTGSGTQDQIRFYLATTLAMMLNGSGINFYGSGGQGDFSLARNGTGRGQLTMGALTVGTDGVGPFVTIPLTQTGGGGEVRFSGAAATGKFREETYGPYTTVGYEKTNGTIGDAIWTFYDNVGGGLGGEKLAIFWDGIGSKNAGIGATDGYTFRHFGSEWVSSIPIRGTKLHAGAAPTYATGAPLTVRPASALANTIASQKETGAIEVLLGDGNLNVLQFLVERSVFNSDIASTYHQLRALSSAGGGGIGGGIDLGFAGTSGAGTPWFALRAAGSIKLSWDHANTRVLIPNNLRVDGSISKGSGTFDIPSPVPGHEETHRLRHGFFEVNDRGGTLVRLAVKVSGDGTGVTARDSNGDEHAATVRAAPGGGYRVRIALPEWWQHLNEFGQVMVNPVDQFAGCYGQTVERGAALLLTVERMGRYSAWVAGTRKDAAARAGWDGIDGGAVEYPAPPDQEAS